MRKGQRLWSRDEILIAINLYHTLTFGQFHSKNKVVIDVSKKIDRTPGSLALKLGNLASLDDSIHQKGMMNYSKLDREVWNEFYAEPENIVYESEILIGRYLDKETELKREVKSRVNQSFFRKSILSSYDNKCCISGLNISSLLVASHIIPWSKDKENRLNPCNGLCLNSLYDSAFDKGFITIQTDYTILVSKELFNIKSNYINNNFIKLHESSIVLPKKFIPKKEFLEYHYDCIFRK